MLFFSNNAVEIALQPWTIVYNRLCSVKRGCMKQTANPYIGCDYGNMMEERMVLMEIYDSLDETDSEDANRQAELGKRIAMINEAAKLLFA